jgi:hypothetical protein
MSAGRFKDISVDVRKEMIECGVMILKHKASSSSMSSSMSSSSSSVMSLSAADSVLVEVEDCVCQRLRDSEWEVRYQALAR